MAEMRVLKISFSQQQQVLLCRIMNPDIQQSIQMSTSGKNILNISLTSFLKFSEASAGHKRHRSVVHTTERDPKFQPNRLSEDFLD